MRRRQRTGRARWVPACLLHGPRTAPSGRRRLLEANETRTFGYDGEWRSLVAHLLWEQRVAGSNPVSPTIFRRTGFSIEVFTFRRLETIIRLGRQGARAQERLLSQKRQAVTVVTSNASALC